MQKKKQRRKTPKQNKITLGTTSKQARMIELLKRPDGATLDDLMSASGWQAHSVRGFLSAAVSKRLGMPVESMKRDDGTRVYRIA